MWWHKGDYVAASLADYLHRHPEMDEKLTRGGSLRFLTTEDTEKFGENAAVFMPHTEGTVEKSYFNLYTSWPKRPPAPASTKKKCAIACSLSSEHRRRRHI